MCIAEVGCRCRNASPFNKITCIKTCNWTWSAKVQARNEFLVTIKTFTMFFHEVMLSVVPCYTTIVAHILLVYEAQWCMRDTIIYVTQQYVRQNSIWGIVVYETQQCERHSSM